jgi:hypothetical protein
MTMTNAQVVNGNKVLVELEWEQIDAIVCQEIREHIIMVESEKNGKWIHPDDKEHNKILLPALYVVYEYCAGEEAANKLKEQLNETIRSAE